MTTISVIIPTLNEAEHLPATLACLRGLDVDEIFVVDGGSTDATVEIARDSDATLIESGKGRSRQMNAGAEASSSSVLLFLHGDTIIRAATVHRLRRILDRRPGVIGGGFLRYFDHPSWFLKFTCFWAGWRSWIWKIYLGDQGIFIRRDEFEALGGFNEEVSPGEDIDLSMRMKRSGKTITVGPAVLSSGRRFEPSPWERTKADFVLARRLIAEARERNHL